MTALNKSQKQILKAVRDFVKGEFDKDWVLELEKRREYPAETLQKAADLGFVGIHFPEEFGGAGMGFFENALAAEEMCRGDSSLGIALTLAGQGAECILRFGSDGLKRNYLSPVAGGKARSSLAVAEPDADGNGQGIFATAVPDGDAWILNGRKTHVLDCGESGFYIVQCRTGDADKQGQNTSLIVVDRDAEGIGIEDLGEKLGINVIPSAEIEFRNVRVPRGNLIGEEGKGEEYLRRHAIESRILAAAQAAGIARGAYERALAYSRERVQFNRPIAKFPAVRHMIAEMSVRIETARLIAFEAARRLDSGDIDERYAATAKLAACRAALDTTYDAIQVMGGYGYMKEYEIEHFYRDAKVLQITGGTPHALKNRIADNLIDRIK